MDTERLLKIIKAVKVHDCLWNASSPEYAKRQILEKAWSEVANEVGLSENFCREKWRNVRTGFLRSIQNNIRIVPDESSNELQAVRRKPFYLFEQMKFLLPSVQALDSSRKRKRSTLLGNTSEGQPNGDHSESNTMMDEFRPPVGKSEVSDEDYRSHVKKCEFNSDEFRSHVRKCEASSDNEGYIDEDQNASYDDCQIDDEISGNYNELLKEFEKSDCDQDETNSQKRKTNADGGGEQAEEKASSLPKKEATEQMITDRPPSDQSTSSAWQNYERESQQLLEFFRGNINDILSLSRRNQRKFKRKFIEIIEELHDAEDANRH